MTMADAPAPAPTPIEGIDHAIIGVADLEAAQAIYAKLGFTISPRGRHMGRGTANYCIMFEHDYLELRGIVDPTAFTDGLDVFLRDGEGLAGLVFSTPDSQACSAALAAAGIAAGEPYDVGRLIELPDEEVSLRFKLMLLPDETAPGVHFVVGQHLTLDLLRRADWLSHANGARRVREVTVLMDDIAGVSAAYGRLFGEAAVSGEERKGDVAVVTPNGTLRFVTPKVFPKRHYDVKPDKGWRLPRLAALTLDVARPKSTALYLSDQKIAFEQEPDGTVLVPAEAACGVLLEFAGDD